MMLFKNIKIGKKGKIQFLIWLKPPRILSEVLFKMHDLMTDKLYKSQTLFKNYLQIARSKTSRLGQKKSL